MSSPYFCHICRTALLPFVLFCPKCGTSRVNWEPSEPVRSAPVRRPRRSKDALVTAVTLAVVAVAVLASVPSSTKADRRTPSAFDHCVTAFNQERNAPVQQFFGVMRLWGPVDAQVGIGADGRCVVTATSPSQQITQQSVETGEDGMSYSLPVKSSGTSLEGANASLSSRGELTLTR